MSTPEPNEHEQRNREQWNAWAADYADAGRRSWSTNDVTWGIWSAPESEVKALECVDSWQGLDVVELGCGTAYVGAWLAQRGASVTGIDNSPEQLETARLLQAEFGLTFPVELGSAESLPYGDEQFDVAISEYGASIWCDPYRWIPEAARVLRPGGSLIFLVNSPLAMMCTPLDGSPTHDRLERPQFGMLRFEWPDDNSVEFHLPHGKMIDLMASVGLAVERLIEIQAPAGASTRYEHVTHEWSHRWPSEEIWIARRCAGSA